MLAAVNLLGVQPLMESSECNMLRMHCEHCFCYLSPLATESGRLYFLEMHETVTIGRMQNVLGHMAKRT